MNFFYEFLLFFLLSLNILIKFDLFFIFIFYFLAKKSIAKRTRFVLCDFTKGQAATTSQIRRLDTALRPLIPANALKWSYVEQPDIDFDTDFGESSVEVDVRKVTAGYLAASGTEEEDSDLMMDDY